MYFDPLSYNIEIRYRINIKGVPSYYFKDTIRSGKINLQNEVYECAPKPDDSYEPILRQYQKKWDNATLLFGLAGNLYYPTLGAGIFTNIDFSSFTDTGTNITYINDGVPAGSCYARKSIAVPADTNLITILISNLSYTGSAPTIKLVNAGYLTCSNEVTISADGKYEVIMSGVESAVFIQLGQVNLTGSSRDGTFDYEIYMPTHVLAGETFYNVLNTIINGISYFNLSPVCSVVSTILWNDPLGSDPPASIDTYMTANPNNDYVLEAAAIFNNLYLCRTDTFTTSKEDNVEICLRDVMDILKSKRLWWFIDEDGKFRIEHEKYFRSYGPQVDLTLTAYDKEMPEVDHFEYSYEDEYFNQVNLTEENTFNPDWTPVRIEYDPLLTGKNVNDLRASVTTDLKNIMDNPAGSGSGLTFLRCDANNNILFDQSLLSTTYYPNQKISPLWISRYYMDYFAESESGTLMTGIHTFLHVRETLSQPGIKFTMASEMDWKKPFTLSIGTGWMGSVQYSPETGWYSVDFLYNPYAVSLGSGSAGGSSTADSTLITADDTITVDTV